MLFELSNAAKELKDTVRVISWILQQPHQFSKPIFSLPKYCQDKKWTESIQVVPYVTNFTNKISGKCTNLALQHKFNNITDCKA